MTSKGNFCGWCAVALLAIGVCAAQGQAPSASQPAPAAKPPASEAAPDAGAQVPTLSSNTNEVTLDLVVKDKKHRPVLDLKAEDLVVTDNDVPVKLNGFHLVSGNAVADSDHLVTLVFDHFTGPPAKIAEVIALKILKMLPSKGYSCAVLDIPGRLRLIQGFTNHDPAADAVKIITEKAAADRTQKIELTYTGGVIHRNEQADPAVTKAVEEAEKYMIAVARTGADPAGTHVDLKTRAQYQALMEALQDSQKEMQDHHTFPNLAGLLALIRSQQKFPERKSLIYFTQNMRMDSAGKEMVKIVTGAAGQAGVSIYIVDLDAMNSQGRYQMVNALLNGQKPYNPAPITIGSGPGGSETVIPMQQEGPAGVQGAPTGQGPSWGAAQTIAQMTDFQRNGFDFRDIEAPKNPLADLAKDTGGLYIDAQDSVKRPLQQMLQDMTTFYQASYIPPIQDYDGSFRTIAVKPANAQLDIKTKTGYFALAPGAEAGIRPFEVPLLNLFNQSNMPQDVKFHAAVLQFGELPEGNTGTVAIDVPISGLETNKDTHTNLFTAHVSIVAEIKDKNGTVVEHFGENISKRGAGESLESDPTSSIILQRHFLAIPGQYLLEAAVYDELGLKYGAQRIVFEIPQKQMTPSLSSIVLVKKVDTINDDNDDPLEPMRYEKGKITPNLSGFVPAGEKGLSLFFILHPDPQSKEPVTLEMEASRNGSPGRRTPLALNLKDPDGNVPYMASFKGANLAPGDYNVKAFMTQGGKTAVQAVSFKVPGAEAFAGGTTAEEHGGGGPVGDLTASSEASDSYSGGLLAITAITNPIAPPASEELENLIAAARNHAVGYAETLPNFMCIEVTNRSADASGAGNWKHRDTIAELLRFRDKTETHTMLEINGQASSADRDALLKQKGSTLSGGEFGGVLKAVFDPSAKADFKWKETDALGSGTVQVFDYHVAKENSMYSVVGSNGRQLTVAFRGQVFIDPSTRDVRRISLEAVDLPKDFPTQGSVLGVDYDYVAINGHDYLMPVSAEVRVRQSHHQAVLNTIEFRDYRKYGSAMKIVDYKEVEKQK
ncbi:MAG TPA: VWA domain-containing protein [Terracidiphilus sp.]|nr:VWA domain-containing protein [Terracidiphilus sp.]